MNDQSRIEGGVEEGDACGDTVAKLVQGKCGARLDRIFGVDRTDQRDDLCGEDRIAQAKQKAAQDRHGNARLNVAERLGLADRALVRMIQKDEHKGHDVNDERKQEDARPTVLHKRQVASEPAEDQATAHLTGSVEDAVQTDQFHRVGSEVFGERDGSRVDRVEERLLQAGVEGGHNDQQHLLGTKHASHSSQRRHHAVLLALQRDRLIGGLWFVVSSKKQKQQATGHIDRQQNGVGQVAFLLLDLFDTLEGDEKVGTAQHQAELVDGPEEAGVTVDRGGVRVLDQAGALCGPQYGGRESHDDMRHLETIADRPEEDQVANHVQNGGEKQRLLYGHYGQNGWYSKVGEGEHL